MVAHRPLRGGRTTNALLRAVNPSAPSARSLGVAVTVRERGRAHPWLEVLVAGVVSLLAMLLGGMPDAAALEGPYCELALEDRAGNRAVVRRCRPIDALRLRHELEALVDGATLDELRDRFGLSERFGGE